MNINRFLQVALLLAATVFWIPTLPAQTNTCSPNFCTTTLLSAVTVPLPGQPNGNAGIYIGLTSVTNAIYSASNTTYLYVDLEVMRVVGPAVGNYVPVSRGDQGTVATTHASGALVWVGPATQFVSTKDTGFWSGTCTVGNSGNPALPIINVYTNEMYRCVGGTGSLAGYWTRGLVPASYAPFPQWRILSPQTGGSIYTGINTNGTVLGATTLYCTEMFLPTSRLISTIGALQGTTVGTDKWVAYLYGPSGGQALANSTLGGTSTTVASTYLKLGLTSAYYALGPSDYYVCIQSNGSTDNLRMAITGTNDNILTTGQTASTFGTAPTLTAPTTFTTAVGGYVYVQ